MPTAQTLQKRGWEEREIQKAAHRIWGENSLLESQRAHFHSRKEVRSHCWESWGLEVKRVDHEVDKDAVQEA